MQPFDIALVIALWDITFGIGPWGINLGIFGILIVAVIVFIVVRELRK